MVHGRVTGRVVSGEGVLASQCPRPTYPSEKKQTALAFIVAGTGRQTVLHPNIAGTHICSLFWLGDSYWGPHTSLVLYCCLQNKQNAAGIQVTLNPEQRTSTIALAAEWKGHPFPPDLGFRVTPTPPNANPAP